MESYVHGYDQRESERLSDQADTLTDLLHGDIAYPPGSLVLEAGCGTGAQTRTLAKRSPGASITAVDLSEDSLERAERTAGAENIANVTFRRADILDLPFGGESFDHVFVCFVLEHLPDPERALTSLKRVLKKGGTLTVVEGDHGSFYCHPETEAAKKTVACLGAVQARMKGDAYVGRKLYPMLAKSGFLRVRVRPKTVYVDSSIPALVDGFSRKTFIAMVRSVKETVLSMNLTDEESWDRGIADLEKAAGKEGTFHYTFFKATAVKG